MRDRKNFFDIDFTTGSQQEVLSLLGDAARSDRTTMLVTPNVDHIVKLRTQFPAERRDVYLSADYFLCDSKIIGRLAAWSGIDLTPRSGVDRVNDILTSPAERDLVVAVIGPTRDQFEAMQARYPHQTFLFIDAPRVLALGSPEWHACVAEAAAAPWHVLLSCLSFPKQELFARDVRAERKERGGLIMCVGATVDFLSGTIQRAPMVWQNFGLEWLHRLLVNPRRLWHRYLVDGPKIFLLYWQYRREHRA